jgi:hypothetical protein
MISFFVAYIVLCIFIVVQYLDKDNVFTLKDYLNFKKNVAILIATEVLLLLFFIIILITNN